MVAYGWFLRLLLSVKENSLFSEDVILLLDEMYLQQEVQYDGRDLTGCDSDLKMYKSILCFMVVSLKQSTPYILKATIDKNKPPNCPRWHTNLHIYS